MDCPVCPNTKLLMSDRQGIEIDYCPNCRGVWLDRGELDKIIERSPGNVPAAVQQDTRSQPYQGQPSPPQGFGRSQQEHYPQHNQGYPQRQQGHYKKKKDGFLGELFDF